MADTLTELVRRKLDITWSDDVTDARVADIVAAAVPTMRHKLGLPEGFDFMAPGQEQTLLLSWCLYEWNQAASEFDQNYVNDILQVRQRWLTEQLAEVSEDGD